MNEKVKYAMVLALAVIISLATSYVTTLSLNQGSQHTSTDLESSSQPSGSPTQTLSNIKILPTYNITLAVDSSYVVVFSNVVIHDLTIVYQYTNLNGTTNTSEFTYGDYTPVFSPNHVIEPGEIPFQYYRIPQTLISACSTTKNLYDSSGILIGKTWDVYPELTVTEVYGYS